MTHFSVDSLELNDFHADRHDAIDLEAAAIAKALNHSRSAAPELQWETYLNSLAAAGFAAWLATRVADCQVESQADATWLINGFRVGAIAAPEEDEVLLSKTQHDQHPCQIYVAVGVDEEYGQTFILGAARYDQLDALAVEGAHYRLPIAQLDPGSNQLLLTLRCSEPAMIPLPQATTTAATAGSTLGQTIANTKIRVGQWLNQQLDDLAQDLAWVLMPQVEPQTVGLRSRAVAPMGSFPQVLQMIQQQGVELAATSQTAYYDLPMTDPAVRFYAMVGQPNPAEWSLLLVVGMADGDALPGQTQLKVGQGEDVLTQQQVEADRSRSYLYTQVIGELDEGFQVTITLPSGTMHTFPEFVFQ
ncbi:MAG: hypothetical protein RLZZ511_337 [Cyanobacteriota bacterium]|jgi:hypothetical protein